MEVISIIVGTGVWGAWASEIWDDHFYIMGDFIGFLHIAAPQGKFPGSTPDLYNGLCSWPKDKLDQT